MRRSRSLARGAAMLGAAMAFANVLGYVFTVVISRSLGPADFGALSALLGLGIVGAVPAGALQISVARRQAHSPDGAAGATALALRVGGALLLLSLLAIPVAVPLLHLDSAWAMVWLGVALVPMTLTGAYQGVLLGGERMRALSLLHMVNGTSRLAAGVVAALLGVDVAGVVATVAIAAWVTCVAGALLVGPLPRAEHHVRRSIRLEITRSSGALVGLLLLSNIDVLLARHFLDAQASGYYGLAALFGKVVFWGTQFIALAVLPRTARSSGHGLPMRASAAVALIGGVATGVVALFADQLVRATGGPAFAPAATYAVAFTLLGTLWALGQVLLFNDLAKEGNHLGMVVWTALSVEVLLVVTVLHDSPGELLFAAIVAAALVVVVGLVVMRARRSGKQARVATHKSLAVASG